MQTLSHLIGLLEFSLYIYIKGKKLQNLVSCTNMSLKILKSLSKHYPIILDFWNFLSFFSFFVVNGRIPFGSKINYMTRVCIFFLYC